MPCNCPRCRQSDDDLSHFPETTHEDYPHSGSILGRFHFDPDTFIRLQELEQTVRLLEERIRALESRQCDGAW